MPDLRSLLRQLLDRRVKTDQSGPETYGQLERLVLSHSLIHVRAPHLDAGFQSIVLRLHPDEGIMVIDELFPAEGRDELVPGEPLEISSPGTPPIAFQSRLLGRVAMADAPVYHIELPDELSSHARRHAFRVYVEQESDLAIQVTAPAGAELDATVVNLSSDGIKLALPAADASLLQQRPVLDARLRLPSDAEVDCRIEVRNVYSLQKPRQFALAGGRLTIEAPQQRVKLQQYLFALQRRQRRRAAGRD